MTNHEIQPAKPKSAQQQQCDVCAKPANTDCGTGTGYHFRYLCNLHARGLAVRGNLGPHWVPCTIHGSHRQGTPAAAGGCHGVQAAQSASR